MQQSETNLIKSPPTPKKVFKMKTRNMQRSVEDPGYGRRGDTLGNRRTQNRPIDPDDFFGDTLGSPKSGGNINRNFGLPPSLQERVKAQLPLPKLGLSSPWWLKTGRTYFSLSSIFCIYKSFRGKHKHF